MKHGPQDTIRGHYGPRTPKRHYNKGKTVSNRDTLAQEMQKRAKLKSEISELLGRPYDGRGYVLQRRYRTVMVMPDSFDFSR